MKKGGEDWEHGGRVCRIAANKEWVKKALSSVRSMAIIWKSRGQIEILLEIVQAGSEREREAGKQGWKGS